MSEPYPPHLDDEGKELWEACDWIASGLSFDANVPAEILAKWIRRQLRDESVKAELLAALEGMVDEVEDSVWVSSTPARMKIARAAIARAKKS